MKTHELNTEIDPATTMVLQSVDKEANVLGVPYMVVGARARLLLFAGVFGLDAGRITHDLDIGIRVPGWSHFLELEKALCSHHDFSRDKQRQRLNHKTGYKLDLVPFGPLEDDERKITWPPEHELEMSTLGFVDAFESRCLLKHRSSGLVIPTPSAAGMAMLKLVAWADRNSRKDARDIQYLAHVYGSIPEIQDRLYGACNEVMALEDHDLDRAAIRLLGRDMRAIALETTLSRLQQILAREIDESGVLLLVSQMSPDVRSTDDHLSLPTLLKRGLEDQC